ncbi:MAG: ectonucleotide pyrophosphatase/phosphodiesterase [Gemmatimonadales bacterium]
MVTVRPRFRWWAIVAAGLASGIGCRSHAVGEVIAVAHSPNAAAQRTKPYVVLVSLDGFRYDYAQRYGATHLLAIAARGATAPDGMVPSYPTVTFPNHWTLATGLYPEHHGIVGNSFYDPARGQTYSIRDPATFRDGSWYGGTPLWVLAEQQGMRSACLFWVGCEAAVQGVRPSYYLRYDPHFANAQRVRLIMSWLALPEAERPHLLTLYVSDVDEAGHQFGPDSPRTADAVRAADQLIGTLDSSLTATHLPVDLIVVSDHGMANVTGDYIYLDAFAPDLASHLTRAVDRGLYPKSDSDAARIFAELQHASDKFTVYRRAAVPAALHFSANPRAGDPIVVATGPYAIRSLGSAIGITKPEAGSHGWDPVLVPDVKATFIAAGPDIRPGVQLPSFENVDLYPLVARILGLDISRLASGPIDGHIEPVQAALAGTPAARGR